MKQTATKLINLVKAEYFLESMYKIEKANPLKLVLDGGRRFPLEDVYKEIIDALRSIPAESSVALPYKIGDRVWAIRDFKGVRHAQEGIVNEMFFTNEMKLMICVKYVSRGYWGETVFATQAEAEKYLKGTAG